MHSLVRRGRISVSRVLFVAALICALTFAGITTTSALPAESGGSAPPVVGRIVDGDRRPVIGEVFVSAWPDDATIAALEIGDEVVTLDLGHATVDSDGRFTLPLDPAGLPEGYINPDGRLHLEVWALERSPGPGRKAAGRLRAGSASATAQLAEVDGRARWVDPVPDAGAGEASLAALDVQVEETVAALSMDGESDGGDVGTMAVICSSWSLYRNTDHWNDVGDSWPVSSVTSRLEYSSGHSRTLGVAVSGNGSSWRASGSSTMSTGWGMNFANSSTKRYYQIQVRYGSYSRECRDTGLRWMEYRFAPRFDTGGTRTVSSTSNPTWSNCVNVAQGTWWRSSSSGSAYSLSGGVKASGTIGINLSVNTQYSSSRRLAYNVSANGRQVCDSNDVPSRAGRVRSKIA